MISGTILPAPDTESNIEYHHNIDDLVEDGCNSSPPGQNGRHSGRRHLQIHFLEWKW